VQSGSLRIDKGILYGSLSNRARLRIALPPSHRWQQYVRFVRAFFLFRTCNRTLLPDAGERTRRKLIEDKWIEHFRQELPARGLEIPSEAELRNLIKQAIRVGRRFIRQHGRITAHKKRDVLQERMVNYVARRCSKSKV